MKLRTYLLRRAISQGQFAAALGVTQPAVQHWLTGRLKISAERAMQIERLTHGEVRAAELRPDLPWPDSPPLPPEGGLIARPAPPPPGGQSFSGVNE